MNSIRRAVVAALLAVWCFPALSFAKPAPQESAPMSAPAPAASEAKDHGSYRDALANLTAREQKAQQLQDYQGGGVVIYLGSGAVVVLVVILLILLV